MSIELKVSETKKIQFSVYTPRSGRPMASIREFYLDGGDWKPGRNGMTLKPEQMSLFAKKLKALYQKLMESSEVD